MEYLWQSVTGRVSIWSFIQLLLLLLLLLLPLMLLLLLQPLLSRTPSRAVFKGAEKLALEECMAALEGSGLTADVAGGGGAALVLGAYILKYRNVLVF